MSRSFFLVPDDTLWLRTGTPFVAGEDDRSGSVFPPTAWTWQGFIRTRILVGTLGDALSRTSKEEITRQIGSPDALPPHWSIRGPLPAVLKHGELEPWVPWPMFLSSADDPDSVPLRARRVTTPGVLRSGTASDHLFFEGGKKSGRGWISASNLCWALLGVGRWDSAGASAAAKSRADGDVLPPFVAEEVRPGVAVNRDNGRVVDQMLYTAVHHRFAAGAGLWGALGGAPAEACRTLEGGAALMGRRGRTVSLTRAPSSKGWESLIEGSHLSLGSSDVARPAAHVRVVLLTPAPVQPGLSAAFELPQGARLRAAIARPGPAIGGFDSVEQGSRAVVATWAAGSTFWIELEAGPARQQGQALCQLAGLAGLNDLERLGFSQRIAAFFNPDTGLPIQLKENDHG